MRKRTSPPRGGQTGGPYGFVILVLAMVTTSGTTLAQEDPINISVVGTLSPAGRSYADIWGDGNFAYVAHFGQRVIDIVDLTDPAHPVLAATYDTYVAAASTRDVKVHDGLMFVGLEQAFSGCHIVDVRDPQRPVKLTDITVLPSVHNVFYDQGWLYLVDSSRPLIDVVDLRAYDPNHPPTTLSTRHLRITGVGRQIVHDITVLNGRLYASAWDTLRIYDVSNIATGAPPLLGTATGSSVHASWATDDGRFLVVAEKHSVSGLTLYEVLSDQGNSVTLKVRDYFFISSRRAGSVGNVVIDGLRVYVSWHAAGIQVLDIDPDTATLTLVASFDTTPADGTDSIFAGNWGVYPMSSDRVLASDRKAGLFVLDVEPNILRFKYPNGLPKTVAPSAETPIKVEVSPVGSPTLASSVARHATVDGGVPAGQTLKDQGGGLFAGTLPAAACGEVINVSFSADNTLGTSFVDPPSTSAGTFRVDVVAGTVPILEDGFDHDMGWTVTGTSVTHGTWERGDPIGTGAQPENDATGADDGSAFFTQQGPRGGSISTADVDGGPTVLTSPMMDFSAGDGIIRYAYWLFSDDGTDDLAVEISNDGATWIEVRRYQGLLGGWHEDVFATSDFVAATDRIQVRFSVADHANNSVTEAAIDNFSAVTPTCRPRAEKARDRDQPTGF